MKYLHYTAHIIPLALLALPLIAGAQAPADYLLVDDLPFVKNLSEEAGLAGYLSSIFRLGIGLAVTLSVVMIVYGGIEYMVSDVPGVKVNAKGRIQNAIWGLVLVLASVLILNTINPNIVKFDLITSLKNAADSVEAPAQTGTTTPTNTGEMSAQERAARDYFATNGVSINNPPCSAVSPGQRCTDVAGLPVATRAAIVGLAENCGTSGCVVITGGSEDGHVTHGINRPFADLRKTGPLNAYIAQNGTFIRDTPIGKLYKLGGHEMIDEGDHWHGCFNQGCNIR